MTKLHEWTPAENYLGSDYTGYYVVVTQNRDSESLDESNFRCIAKELMTFKTDFVSPSGDEDVMIAHFGHWAVGWVEYLMIHKSNKDAVKQAETILGQLENYGIFDEDDWSTLEHDKISDYWESLSDEGKEKICKDAKSAVSYTDIPEEVYDMLLSWGF